MSTRLELIQGDSEDLQGRPTDPLLPSTAEQLLGSVITVENLPGGIEEQQSRRSERKGSPVDSLLGTIDRGIASSGQFLLGTESGGDFDA